eukprot:1179287-Prorocentrum_minimum.AAC.3
MNPPSAETQTVTTPIAQVIANPKATTSPTHKHYNLRTTPTIHTILHIFFWFLACAICHFDYCITTPGTTDTSKTHWSQTSA